MRLPKVIKLAVFFDFKRKGQTGKDPLTQLATQKAGGRKKEVL